MDSEKSWKDFSLTPLYSISPCPICTNDIQPWNMKIVPFCSMNYGLPVCQTCFFQIENSGKSYEEYYLNINTYTKYKCLNCPAIATYGYFCKKCHTSNLIPFKIVDSNINHMLDLFNSRTIKSVSDNDLIFTNKKSQESEIDPWTIVDELDLIYDLNDDFSSSEEEKQIDFNVVRNKLTDTKLLDSKPLDSKLLDSKPLDSKPLDSKPLDSKPLDTKPLDTKPLDSKTLDSKLLDSKTLDSKPLDSKPLDSKPLDSKLLDSKTLDMKTLDSKSLDSKSLDSKPLDNKPLHTKPLDIKPLDSKPLDSKPLDSKTLDRKTLNSKALDSKAFDSKAFDSKAFDSKAFDSKTFDSKLVQNAAVENSGIENKAFVIKPNGANLIDSKTIETKTYERQFGYYNIDSVSNNGKCIYILQSGKKCNNKTQHNDIYCNICKIKFIKPNYNL